MSSVLPKSSSSVRPLGFLVFSFFVPLGLVFFLLSSEAGMPSSAGWEWRRERGRGGGGRREGGGEKEGKRVESGRIPHGDNTLLS